MPDETTVSYELKFEFLFLDGDTRVTTLKNPKTTITTEEITALETLIKDEPQTAQDVSTPLLVGDKTGSEFRRINLVTKDTISRTVLGLTKYW